MLTPLLFTYPKPNWILVQLGYFCRQIHGMYIQGKHFERARTLGLDRTRYSKLLDQSPGTPLSSGRESSYLRTLYLRQGQLIFHREGFISTRVHLLSIELPWLR